MAVFILNKSI